MSEFASTLPKNISKKTSDELIGVPSYDQDTVERRFLRDVNPLRLMPYQLERQREQVAKLEGISKQENITRRFISTTNIFYNLSLKELGENLSKTWVDVMNELIIFNQLEKEKDFKTFLNIFLEQDRLIYVGITIVVIALMLYVVSVTM